MMREQQTTVIDIVQDLLEAATDRPFMPSTYKNILKEKATDLIQWCKDTEAKASKDEPPKKDEWGD